MCDPERFTSPRTDHSKGALYEDNSFYTTVRPSPPPPLPGVFVVDPPKQQINISQRKFNLVQPSKNVNTTYGNPNKIPAFSGFNGHAITPNQIEFQSSSLDIFDYPLDEDQKDFSALQPLIQNTEDTILQGEENVYHTLQPVPHNVFDIPSSSEPKIYQQLQPVQKSGFSVCLKKSGEPKLYQHFDATQIDRLHDFTSVCQSARQQKDTTSIEQLSNTAPSYDPPHYTSSKLYQQLRQPLNKSLRMSYQTGSKTSNNAGPVTSNNFEQSRHLYRNQDQHIQNTDQIMFASQGRSNSFPNLQRLNNSKSCQGIQQPKSSRISLSNHHESSTINNSKPLPNLQYMNASPDKGFQSNKPKVYLELRNPSIRHQPQATQSSYQLPAVDTQYSNCLPGGNRSHENKNYQQIHTSFEKNESKTKQLKLPGPYEFNLSQNKSKSYKLPKILCPQEYTTSPQLTEQSSFHISIQNGDMLPNKYSVPPIKQSKSLLSLPKAPVCYGDSNVGTGSEHTTTSIDYNKTESQHSPLKEVSHKPLATSTFSHKESDDSNKSNNAQSVSNTHTKLQELLMATNVDSEKTRSSAKKQDSKNCLKKSYFNRNSDHLFDPDIISNYSGIVQNNLSQNGKVLNIMDGNINRKQQNLCMGDQSIDLKNSRNFPRHMENTCSKSYKNNDKLNEKLSYSTNYVQNSIPISDCTTQSNETDVTGNCNKFITNTNSFDIGNISSRPKNTIPQNGECCLHDQSVITDEYCKIDINNEATINSFTNERIGNSIKIDEKNHQDKRNNCNLVLNEKPNFCPTHFQHVSLNKDRPEENNKNKNSSKSDLLKTKFNETKSRKNVSFTHVQHCINHNEENLESTIQNCSEDINNKIISTNGKVSVQSNISSLRVDVSFSQNGLSKDNTNKKDEKDFESKTMESSELTCCKKYSHLSNNCPNSDLCISKKRQSLEKNRNAVLKEEFNDELVTVNLIETPGDKNTYDIQNATAEHLGQNILSHEQSNTLVDINSAIIDCKYNCSLSSNKSDCTMKLSGSLIKPSNSNNVLVSTNSDKNKESITENKSLPIQQSNDSDLNNKKPCLNEDQSLIKTVSVPPLKLGITDKSEKLARKYKKRKYLTNCTDSSQLSTEHSVNYILESKEKTKNIPNVLKSVEVNITLNPCNVSEMNLGRRRTVKKVDYKILNGGEEEEDIIKVKKRKYNKSVKRFNCYKVKEVKSSGLLITNTAAFNSKTRNEPNKSMPLWGDEEAGIRKKRKYTKRAVNANKDQQMKFDKQGEDSPKTNDEMKKEDKIGESFEISSSLPAPAKLKEEFIDPLEEGLISDNEDEVVFLGFDMPSEDDETILGFDFNSTREDLDPVNSLGHLEVDLVTVDCDPRSLMQSPPMLCPQCAKTFTSHQELVNHLQWHSAIQSPHSHSYVCSVCFRGFPSQDKLEKHIKWNHEGGKRFSCPICPKRFTTKAYVKRHVETIHKEEKSEANIFCDKAADSSHSDDLSTTNEDHTPQNRLHQCETCLRSFEKFANLQRHMISHSEAEHAFSCVHCNQTFSSEELLQSHRSVHQDKKLFKCETCDSEFTAANSLKRHKFLHAKEKLFRCEICQRSFSLLSTLKTHLLIHTGARRYECRLCHKTFNRRDVLNAHQWIHTGEKKFQCDICKQKFRWRHAVKSHKLIYHSTSKPFICKICGKKFSHPDSFKKHAQVHSDRLYLCQICLKSFSRPNTLKTHIITHTNHKPFFCDVCNKGFRSKGHLKSHFLVHSKDKPWLCKFCNKTYKDHNQLRRHKRVVHCKAFYNKVLSNVPEYSESITEADSFVNQVWLPEKNNDLLEIRFKEENIIPQSYEHFISKSFVEVPNSEENNSISLVKNDLESVT